MDQLDADINSGPPSMSALGGHGAVAPRGLPGAHVVVSELVVAEAGIASLEAAFSSRLGEVDSFPGHLGLQVWRDDHQPGRYVMVTWWETADAFRQYMRSDSHRRSHARIPSEPARPKAVRVDRFSLVTD
ncbi:MAG: antibiotic biosynthesis monooxygenase family protein [Ilumatobacteraceae bacterium]